MAPRRLGVVALLWVAGSAGGCRTDEAPVGGGGTATLVAPPREVRPGEPAARAAPASDAGRQPPAPPGARSPRAPGDGAVANGAPSASAGAPEQGSTGAALVTATVPVGEDGEPQVVPALRGATRVGPGPWLEDRELAIGAGWLDTRAGEALVPLAEATHRRSTFVLLARGGVAPPATGERTVDLWLAEAEARSTGLDAAIAEHRRVAAIELHGGAVESQDLGSTSGFSCSAATEVRVRDVDGDGEVEVTVVAAYLRRTRERWGGGGTPDECGAVAFVVGASDWNVQASFTREYAVEAFAASIEVYEHRATTWRLADIDHDGHDDLRVTETWRFLDDSMGDDVGGGETVGPSRRTGSERRQLDCLYLPARDEWSCQTESPPGQLLFGDPAERGRTRGRRPW